MVFALGCASASHKSRSVSWLAEYESWHQKTDVKGYSIQRVTDIARHQQDSLRFEVRPGDGWTNHGRKTFRAEISTEVTAPFGSEQWYGFSLYIPANFPKENNRLILAQWWGETRPNDPVVRSPPLALRYRNGRLYIDLRYLGGSPKEIFSGDLFELGKWHDFIFYVKWSASEGFAHIWLNKQKVAEYHGPIGDEAITGITPQFGIYRDDSKKTYVCYFNEYRVGSTFDEVDPGMARYP